MIIARNAVELSFREEMVMEQRYGKARMGTAVWEWMKRGKRIAEASQNWGETWSGAANVEDDI